MMNACCAPRRACRAILLYALVWWAVLSLFAAVVPAQERASTPEFDLSVWRKDGFPLQPGRDADALRSIWSTLEATTSSTPFANAVTLQLQRQSGRYKGKLLSVEGRLLRADRVPLSDDEYFCDLWILLPDSKTDPVRLLARRAPEGFAFDTGKLPAQAGDKDVEYRHETIRAKGVYYRTTAYDAGVDLLAAPTLVSEGFEIVNDPASTRANGPGEGHAASRGGGLLIKVSAVLAIVAIWFALRSATRRRRTRPRGKGISPPIILALAFAATCNVFGADVTEGNEFWGSLSGIGAEKWSIETRDGRPRLDEQTPESAERRSAALGILGIGERLLSTEILLERAALGEVRRLRGTLVAVERLPLNASEEDRVGAETVCRATIELESGGRAAVYLVRTPKFAAPASFFFEKPSAPQNSADAGVGERVETLGICFGVEEDETLAFLAPRMAWTPDSAPLGRAGVDLAAFESVPVLAPDALENASTDETRRQIARALRWTTDDRRAFYGSLAGYRDRAVHDDRGAVGVVELFNSPQSVQGARVRLRGWVRRVNMILVTDPEIIAETGIDRYYQLYLFTDDSQSWPIVLCAPELPPGLATGGGSDYRCVVAFDGFFYKTWAYEISDESRTSESADFEEDSDAPIDLEAAKRWIRAPVAIGRITDVVLEEESRPAPMTPTAIFISFALLACAWIILRRVSLRSGTSLAERRRR